MIDWRECAISKEEVVSNLSDDLPCSVVWDAALVSELELLASRLEIVGRIPIHE